MKKFIIFVVTIFLLIMPFSSAISSSIIAINDTVILSNVGSEAITYNSEIYVPYTTFSKELGISSSYNSTANKLVLYNFDKIVTFDLSASTITDETGTSYRGNAILRGSTVYVPARTICNIFNLSFTRYIQNNIEITRIYDPQQIKLSNDVLFSLAVEHYKASLDADKPNPTTPTPPVTPDKPSTQDPTIEEEVVLNSKHNVKIVYLTMINTLSKSNIDKLKNENVTFFVDETFDAEALRYAYINGKNLGIYVKINDNLDDIVAYITSINNKFFDEIGEKTRFVYIQNNNTFKNDLINLGYVPITADYSSFKQSYITTSAKKSLIFDISKLSNINSLLNFAKTEQILIPKLTLFS